MNIGLVAGPLLFLLVFFLPFPSDVSPEAQRALAVAGLMAVWWITEAIPIGATALVPLALYPLLSVMPAVQTARAYADPNIFLFMGGFMLAIAMQKWNLHRRIALWVVRTVGGGPRRILGGFLLATALISMWVSNTATALMILPIGIAVTSKIGFGKPIMLAIAYASSIGGAATLIGTPPNMIFAGQSKVMFPELGDVGFLRWMLFAVPLAFGFLLITWAYLSLVMLRGASPAMEGEKGLIQKEIKALGPLARAELGVMVVFAGTVFLWVFREYLPVFKSVHDGTIAMLGALCLFLWPVDLKKRVFLLDWQSAKALPWEVLLLFGGGFALAESIQATGLAAWLGNAFTVFRGIPVFWFVLVLCLGTTFISEFISNTAQVTMMMPVLGAASSALGVHPYLLMIPATLAASFAFMMPVGTPPNAVVFGSGHLKVSDMAKTGFALNILGSLWITLFVYFFLPLVFGVR